MKCEYIQRSKIYVQQSTVLSWELYSDIIAKEDHQRRSNKVLEASIGQGSDSWSWYLSFENL